MVIDVVVVITEDRTLGKGSGWEPETLNVTTITGDECNYRNKKNPEGVTGTDVPESSSTSYLHGPPGFQQALSPHPNLIQ